jgi:phospholipase A2
MYLKPILIAHLIGIIAYVHHMEASQTIHNKTNFPLYMAGYITAADAERNTKIIEIRRHASAAINVPPLGLFTGKRRYIALSHKKDDLAEHLFINSLKALPLIDISSQLSRLGGTYYVVEKEIGRIAIYTNFGYSKIGKFIEALTKNIRQKFSERIIDEKKILSTHESPHLSQAARVRTGTELSTGELNYLKQRAFKVQEALRSLLPATTERILFPKTSAVAAPRVPIISVILSGGGNRAMFSSCGFMQGLQEIGILDATTYIAALSGSTWFLGSWFASNIPLIADFRKKLVQTMVNGLRLVSAHEYSLMFDEFKVKYLYHQPITSMDLLGALLGNALFRGYSDKRYQIYLSNQKNNVENGMWPFPIYTAVDGSKIAHRVEGWYEFTPYEVGGNWLKSYIPTWAFGRRFAQGKSVDDAPEIPLAFLFGIFGSAPSVDIYRAWQEMEKRISISEQIKTFMYTHILNPSGHIRLTDAEEFNFTAGIPTSPLRYEKYMTIVDGGYGHNLPYPVVSGEREGRTSDILIFFDASGDVTNFKTSIDAAATQLHKARDYARDHHLKFPPMTEVLPQMINIYKDETDPSVPIVMWIPCIFDTKKYASVAIHDKRFTTIKDFDFSKCINTFCATTNFTYSVAQAEQLMTLGQFCAHACQHEIIEAIAWKMEHMKP